MKILVPLDGSTFSESILGVVAQVARASRAEVHLLTVVEEPGGRRTWLEALAMVDMASGDFGVAMPAPTTPPSGAGAETGSSRQTLERALGTAREYLATAAKRFPSGSAKTRAIADDDIVKTILGYSSEEKIDFIAMSTHGRSGIGRWVMGSTADKLLHTTTLPMFLISPTDNCDISSDTPVDTLVVPLDGSELAEYALPYVENLARQLSIKISLVRVVSTPALAYPGTEAYAYDPKIFSELEKDAVSYLSQKQATLEQKGFQVESTVKGGYPADHIVDFAEARPGSLIVMSTHGRSGIGRWVMGSVADRVISASCRPILLVRSPGQSS